MTNERLDEIRKAVEKMERRDSFVPDTEDSIIEYIFSIVAIRTKVVRELLDETDRLKQRVDKLTRDLDDWAT